MANPRSNWTGIAFGLGLAYLAAYQQFKLPPVLPVLLGTYHYDRTLAGAFMSVYAVAGLTLSWLLGRSLTNIGLTAPIVGALGLMVLGSALTLAAPATPPRGPRIPRFSCPPVRETAPSIAFPKKGLYRLA